MRVSCQFTRFILDICVYRNIVNIICVYMKHRFNIASDTPFGSVRCQDTTLPNIPSVNKSKKVLSFAMSGQ